ncbi:MAG: hypothetical protein ABMA14_19330 [Hyphomonadaceae bacterium]
MTAKRDDGYILASAIGVLLAISIVAATLVGTSGESLRRMRRAETAASQETTLQSALTLLASQLILDPRRRALNLTAGTPLTVLDQTVKFRIGWESSKVDVNLAEPEVVETRLQRSGLDAKALEIAMAAIRRSRAMSQPISLLTELNGDQTTQTCIASLLTVFSGQSNFDPELKAEPPLIGRPAAGSRLAIDLAVSGAEPEGLSTVILITGDPLAPWQVMDWRRSSSLAGEPCHAV